MNFSCFYHIWTWRPPWSCDLDHMNKFSFPYSYGRLWNLASIGLAVSGEKKLGMAANLVMWPLPFEQTFVPPSQGGSTWNLASIGPVVSEEIFENVDTHTYGRQRPTYIILNQIPNATSNTFLNNSKPTECRLILFKPWLDECVRHSIFKFERSAWFHARAFDFCLMVPPFEKVTKRRQKITIFDFVLPYVNVFVFVICRHFTTVKCLKVLKLSKIYLKMLKAMTQKNNNKKNNQSEHFAYQWTDNIQFTL